MAIRELDLEKDLNNYLEQATDVKAPFEIKDDKAADWALRKIREAEARIEQVQRFADERKAEIDAWAETATEREAHTITFFTGLLKAYHFKLHQDNPRIKTIKLPAGELQLRKSQPQYSRDDDKLTAWLKAHRPEFVRIKESPDWAEAKKALAVAGRHLVDPETGEIVDGVEVYEPGEPTFRVKTRKGDE
jgi:hypothetical protein